MKKKIVKITNCQNIFKFGDGRKVKSLQKVLIPAKIGAKHLVSVIKGNKENCTKITCTISSFLLARFIEEILQNIKLDIKCSIDSNGLYIYMMLSILQTLEINNYVLKWQSRKKWLKKIRSN